MNAELLIQDLVLNLCDGLLSQNKVDEIVRKVVMKHIKEFNIKNSQTAIAIPGDIIIVRGQVDKCMVITRRMFRRSSENELHDERVPFVCDGKTKNAAKSQCLFPTGISVKEYKDI